MEKKFVIPAVTMLAGIIVWIAFFLLSRGGIWLAELSTGIEVVMSLAAGGLVVFSGVRCRQVDGPRAGNLVRSVILFLMAAISYWKIGVVAGSVLLIGAIITGVLALMGSEQTRSVEEAVSPSGHSKTKAE
jgi:hypothetical protein